MRTRGSSTRLSDDRTATAARRVTLALVAGWPLLLGVVAGVSANVLAPVDVGPASEPGISAADSAIPAPSAGAFPAETASPGIGALRWAALPRPDHDDIRCPVDPSTLPSCYPRPMSDRPLRV